MGLAGSEAGEDDPVAQGDLVEAEPVDDPQDLRRNAKCYGAGAIVSLPLFFRLEEPLPHSQSCHRS